MMYKVVSYRTRTFCKVFAVPELYDQPIIWGTWKTLRHAKKVQARLTSRTLTLPGFDAITSTAGSNKSLATMEEALGFEPREHFCPSRFERGAIDH